MSATIYIPRDSGALPMVAQRIAISGVADLPEQTLTFDNAVIVTSDGSSPLTRCVPQRAQ